MKKGPWALKLSFKYVYNINQNRSYMQLPQTTLYNSSQGSSPGLPRGLFAPGAARELPGASPGQPWTVAYRSTIEQPTEKDPDRPDHRQVESSLRREQCPDGQQHPRLQRSPRDLDKQRALDSTGSHRQALVNKSLNIIPGRRNLVY